MEIKPIHEKWGSFIHASYEEVMNIDPDYWIDLGYERDLLIFRGLNQISELDFFNFISIFGNPWNNEQYDYSNEYSCEVSPGKYISKFSNFIAKRLNTRHMPWHADIPNKGEESFPWRCLYIVKNPNPDSGITQFLNLRLDLIQPTQEELDLYAKIKVLNQSWYRKDEDLVVQNYIKTHPITGLKSLRSNYFINYKSADPMAWIRESYLDDKKVEPYDLIGPIHKKLQSREDLVYTHKWQDYDLILYDNWNFIHRRTHLNLKPKEERLFFRANISHMKI